MKKHFLSSTITKAVGTDGAPVYRFIASTNSKDRHGEAILQSGWELDNYLKNSQVLYGHDSWSFPIGKTVKLELTDNALIADIVFASKEANEKAEQVRLLVEEGILSAVSVGFIPKDIQDIDGVRTITQAELLEISIVPIPANQDAVRIAKSKGFTLEGLLEKGAEDAETVLDFGTDGLTAEMNEDGTTATIRDENGDVVDENVPVVSREEVASQIGEQELSRIEEEAQTGKTPSASIEHQTDIQESETKANDAEDGLIEVDVEIIGEKDFDDEDDDCVAVVEVDEDGFVKITDIDDYKDDEEEDKKKTPENSDDTEEDADELDIDPEMVDEGDEKNANCAIMEEKAGRRLSQATIETIATARGHAEKSMEHLTAFVSALDDLVKETGGKTVGDYVLIHKNDLKSVRDMIRNSDKSVGDALSFLKNF
jgi:HK97 family phage prohead protease